MSRYTDSHRSSGGTSGRNSSNNSNNSSARSRRDEEEYNDAYDYEQQQRLTAAAASRGGGAGGIQRGRGAGTHNRPWMSDEAGMTDMGHHPNRATAPIASASASASASTSASAPYTGTGSSRYDNPRTVSTHSASSSRSGSNSVSQQERESSDKADQLVQAYLRRRSRDEDEEDGGSSQNNTNDRTNDASASASRREYLQRHPPQQQQQQQQTQQQQTQQQQQQQQQQNQQQQQAASSQAASSQAASSQAASSSYARYLQQKQQGQGPLPTATASALDQRNHGPPSRGRQPNNTAPQLQPPYDASSPVRGGGGGLPPRRMNANESSSATTKGVVAVSPLPPAPAVETSRELRSRRLREQSRTRSNSQSRSLSERGATESSQSQTQTQTQTQNHRPQIQHHLQQQQEQVAAAAAAAAHYQAHSPLVEKYLTRGKMMEGGPGGGSNGELSTTQRRVSEQTGLPSRPAPPPPPAATAVPVAAPAPSTRGSPRNSSRHGRPQLTVDTSAETSSNSLGSNNSNVDQYLAQRTELKRSPPPPVPTPVPFSSTAAQASQSRKDDDTNVAIVESSSGDAGDGDESDSGSEGDDYSGSSGDNGPVWSLRATVVSAVDFPTSVVPNLPFSPVLKVALVQVPVSSQGENPQGQDADADAAAHEKSRKELASKIESKGLGYVKGARIRCTSSKILSKRDNGSVEFHEEMRWDNIKSPTEMVLVVELSARAVMTPVNARESPSNGSSRTTSPSKAGSDTGSDTGMSKFGNMLMKGMNPARPSGPGEMETANAAAAVAKLLVEGEESGPIFDSRATSLSSLPGNQSETDVKLRPRKSRKKRKMTEDIRLGSQIVPLSKLNLEKAMNGVQSARIEQWIELETLHDAFTSGAGSSRSPSSSKIRNPSILMEICFSSFERMDDSEDDMDEDDDTDPQADINASFSKRASMKIRSQIKDESPQKEIKDEEPVLQPGVIDFLCVVGARDIGSQMSDDGSKGWVNSSPECCLLEQFPPSDEYHAKNGRMSVLPNKVEWFCFPEGVKLWRGKRPPSHEDLNLKRFSGSSPPNVATSYAAFDACLGCTTSFAWFVFASNSEEYGSDSVKTYGAVIRFYVPAPTGIDSTQDDFAQTVMGGKNLDDGNGVERRRLWVPIGICMTSSLPIVGVMETMLLRLCKELGSTRGSVTAESVTASSTKMIYDDLNHAVFNFQRPIRGVVQCSIPFLNGEPMHIGLPPRTGLPALPHGNSIVAVCRLVGADGLNFLLAAFLTECKIVLHSNDVANVSLVAEVMTALLYPFSWSLPYIPVLPAEMMEFIEAPLSYLLGVPSCNVKLVDPSVFEDVVVVDLDSDFSSTGYFEGRRTESSRAKAPTPLPATTASNISKAVHRMLRAQEEVEEAIGDSRSFPRMEPESLAEREFRLAVAVEVSSLIMGYEDNLVFASESQPVFNVDKFLQTAPALFEQQRGASATVSSSAGQSGRVLSPRSKRFLSQLVNCQHFHQLLETLDLEQSALFHEIMGVLKIDGKRKKSQLSDHFSSPDGNKSIDQLNQYMQKREDKIPTYRVKRNANESNYVATTDVLLLRDILQPIVIAGESPETTTGGQEPAEGNVKSLSLEYLVELEKNPWRYNKLFNIEMRESDQASVEKVKLREAIGDRRYRSWKAARDRGRSDPDDLSINSDDSGSRASGGGAALDLTGLLTLSDEAPPEVSDSAQQRIADAKDRDALRRCLEKAWAGGNSLSEAFFDKGRNLVTEAEVALRNPSAQHFLLAVLKKRLRAESQAPESDQEGPKSSRRGNQSISSKLEPGAFEVLVRLGCAMLDACMEGKKYEPAYSFLKDTAGLYTTAPESSDYSVVYMTGRIGQHPIFADLGVWEKVKDLHLAAHIDEKDGEKRKAGAQEGQALDKDDAEYEAAKATLYEMLGYGIPAEELARFVGRVSENNGWFQSERGKTLLLLARRLSVRREQGADSAHPSTTTDIELMSPKSQANSTPQTQSTNTGTSKPTGANSLDDGGEERWTEIGWCHPAAKSSRRALTSDKSRRPGTQNEQTFTTPGSKHSGHMKRSAVTSLAYLGSSVVVTGGLDGGVFMARKVSTNSVDASGEENYGIRGVHLDWGSSGSRYTAGSSSTSLDGEYGVGSVTCLAATRGAEHPGSSGRPTKDVGGPLDDEDLLSAMEGNRVVAGTTCGDLRVWSVKDVFAAVFYTNGGDVPNQHEGRIFHRGGEGASAGFIGGRRKPATDFAAGSSLTRLKFSLRGRALSGHRGGVSCIDVPSNVYRPDSVVSGGADGLIKLWSLRAPGAIAGRRNEMDKGTSQMLTPKTGDSSPRSKAARNGDALSILSGHGGRVLCVKTAWHGDRLLSGGADRTVRVWDLANSGGKCLHTLSGHFGWVTAVHYWGPNTIISASTDRSIALWDARVRSSPLFTLRHHHAPVSDLLVGSRTDPVMVSSASDGSIAAWDFRLLSGADDSEAPVVSAAAPAETTASTVTPKKVRQCKVVRYPAAKLYMHDFCKRRQVYGPVSLARGPSRQSKTVMVVGGDAVTREWDFNTGKIVAEHATGHCDTVSCFRALQGDKFLDTQLESTSDGADHKMSGTITTSWDGTVRMRTLARKY